MRLIMKQKAFSWIDRFRVWDGDGHDRYYVEGEFFALGKRLHITNPDGQEVALVQQKGFSFLPRFFVWVDGLQVAEIVTIHKEWLTWGDCYVLDIADSRDTVTALAVVLAIDCVHAAAAASAANAHH